MRTTVALLLILCVAGCGMSSAKRLEIAGRSYKTVTDSLTEMLDQFDADERAKIIAANDAALVYLTDWRAAIAECADPNYVGPCNEYVGAEDAFNLVLDTLLEWYAQPAEEIGQ